MHPQALRFLTRWLQAPPFCFRKMWLGTLPELSPPKQKGWRGGGEPASQSRRGHSSKIVPCDVSHQAGSTKSIPMESKRGISPSQFQGPWSVPATHGEGNPQLQETQKPPDPLISVAAGGASPRFSPPIAQTQRKESLAQGDFAIFNNKIFSRGFRIMTLYVWFQLSHLGRFIE